MCRKHSVDRRGLGRGLQVVSVKEASVRLVERLICVSVVSQRTRKGPWLSQTPSRSSKAGDTTRQRPLLSKNPTEVSAAGGGQDGARRPRDAGRKHRAQRRQPIRVFDEDDAECGRMESQTVRTRSFAKVRTLSLSLEKRSQIGSPTRTRNRVPHTSGGCRLSRVKESFANNCERTSGARGLRDAKESLASGTTRLSRVLLRGHARPGPA